MEKIKSKFRISTILLLVFLLSSFGSFLYIYIFYLIPSRIKPIELGGVTFALILFLIGVIFIFAFTKNVTFKNDRIIIRYIFRFKTYDYKYTDIEGFRWKYVFAKINYKSIKIKTKDHKVFTISDFEYSNFRKLEKVIVSNFSLKTSKKWLSPNKQEIEYEFSKSHEFDIDQAKDIRDFTFIFGVACIALISFVLYSIINIGFRGKNDFILILVLITSLLFLIRKFLKAIKFLKRTEN